MGCLSFISRAKHKNRGENIQGKKCRPKKLQENTRKLSTPPRLQKVVEEQVFI